LATSLVGSNICFKNNAQELPPYRFEFTCDTNRIRKYFLSLPRFEPGSLGWLVDGLANSATPLLIISLFFEIYYLQEYCLRLHVIERCSFFRIYKCPLITDTLSWVHNLSRTIDSTYVSPLVLEKNRFFLLNFFNMFLFYLKY
jgi:hypothetical protein